ncbi:hypothetical protein [Lentzea pudingi]|uniref:hypothetical protein n=1 Tax=Lentzea pudingi TaxID=1789439 RepID=UPI001669267D|nr:hypothetical protein [Lentzea pudingi]
MDKHIASGKTRTEALRLLRRRLSDVACRALIDQTAIGAPTRAFRVELVDRVIDQYWQQEQ